MSKRLGEIEACKYKTSSWHLNGFPDGNNIGSTVKCRGEAHRYTVHLCRDTRNTLKTKQRPRGTPSHMVVIYYYIGYKYKASTWYLNGFPNGSNHGQQYNVGEKPTVILYTYINHHAQPPIITQHKHCNT